MGQAAKNVIPLEVLKEEAAKNMAPSATSLAAKSVVEESGQDIRMAEAVLAELWKASQRLSDGVIRLPRGVELPLLGASIVLPPGMRVAENGKIEASGEYLEDGDLGSVTLKGGLSEKDLEDILSGLHQSVSSVVRLLKLSDHVTTILGHVEHRKCGKKSVPSLKIYTTGKPFVLADYRNAKNDAHMLVPSNSALRGWAEEYAGDTERPQNFVSRQLFTLKKAGMTAEALIAEKDRLQALVDDLKNSFVELDKQYQEDVCFRNALVVKMVELSAGLQNSTHAKLLNLAAMNESHFNDMANDVLLKTYRQLLIFSALPVS